MQEEKIIAETQFKATLSGGPGGQHANKTHSQIILYWDLSNSKCFTAKEKQRLSQKLSSYLNKDGVLQMRCAESRSQFKNKQLVIRQFLQTLKKSLKVPRKRKKTLPTKAARLKRLQNKRLHSEKKRNRKPPL